MTHVRIILDCDEEHIAYAAELAVKALPDIRRSARGPGWGWSYGRSGKPSFFIRMTKSGLSATQHRDAQQ